MLFLKKMNKRLGSCHIMACRWKNTTGEWQYENATINMGELNIDIIIR